MTGHEPVSEDGATDLSGFPTPGEAAVDSYSPAAKAVVVSVSYLNDREAEVTIDTDPHYLYYVHVERSEDGWLSLWDHN